LRSAPPPDYTRGVRGSSNDSGVNWTMNTDCCNFQVWTADLPGTYFKAGLVHIWHPALLTIVHKRGELTVNGYDKLSSLDDEYLTGQVGVDVEGGDDIEATTLPCLTYGYHVPE
ncbi:unnamed protein product, partial [marine sediment metagenome]